MQLFKTSCDISRRQAAETVNTTALLITKLIPKQKLWMAGSQRTESQILRGISESCQLQNLIQCNLHQADSEVGDREGQGSRGGHSRFWDYQMLKNKKMQNQLHQIKKKIQPVLSNRFRIWNDRGVNRSINCFGSGLEKPTETGGMYIIGTKQFFRFCSISIPEKKSESNQLSMRP